MIFFAYRLYDGSKGKKVKPITFGIYDIKNDWFIKEKKPGLANKEFDSIEHASDFANKYFKNHDQTAIYSIYEIKN
ncbi:hypothetical protein X286_00740 [Oenococcus oeni IOEB_9517]|nr:hypothetical protein X286_00740 [Oenococcus oeni IOEB_9517]